MNQTLAAPNGIAFDNLGDLAAISSASPFGVAGFQRTQLIPNQDRPNSRTRSWSEPQRLSTPRQAATSALSLTNLCLGSQLRVLLSLKNPSARQNAATQLPNSIDFGKAARSRA